MGEFVSVDPERVRKLANRLKDLEEVLARHGSSIRKKFREWDGELDLSLIGKQTHAVGDDARDMAKRADVARNLEEHGEGAALCTPDGNLVNIPWDMKDVRAQSAKEAKQEAQTLKTALDHLQQIKLVPPNSRFKISLVDPKAAAKADIKAIAQSLADHKDDPAYLAAFADAGGVSQAARLARVLHQRDGTHDGKVLSDESTKLIGQYAQGINQIFHLPKDGKNSPGPTALKSLTHPPGADMWSVGMLFKYGPEGDKWEPTVLSSVGGSLLDWRAKQKAMRPSYAAGSPENPVGGYADDGDEWYHSLGLDPAGLSNNIDEAGGMGAAIRANDPALALLSRVGENSQASRDLLTQPDGAGLRHAKQLVDFRWQTPGLSTVDDSDAVRRVLTLAATDRSDAHQDQSGHAADNIFTAAAQEKKNFDDRDNLEQTEFTTYPKGTAIGLATVTGTYAIDIGKTTQSADGGSHGYGPRGLGTNSTDIGKVMELFAERNAKAAGAFDGTLHTRIAESAAATNHGGKDIKFLATTAGMFAKTKAHVGYTAAEKLDEQHTKQLFVANTVAGLIGGVPGPAEAAPKVAKGLLWVQMAMSGGRAALTDQFSVDNADKREEKNRDTLESEYMSFAPSLAQGLLDSGSIKPPMKSESRGWYNRQTGQIDSLANHHNGFNSWWPTIDPGLQDEFREAYDHASGFYDGKGK